MTKRKLRTPAALAAVALAAMLFAPTGHAKQGLLGVELDGTQTQLLFNQGGNITYVPGVAGAPGTLSIRAFPYGIQFAGLPPSAFTGTTSFRLDLPVDTNGNVLPGQKGTLTVIGELAPVAEDFPVPPPVCGGAPQCVLVTGEVSDFGFVAGPTFGSFDFRGTFTGGELVTGSVFPGFLPGDFGIVASTAVSNPSFATEFSGQVEGTLGQLVERLPIHPVFSGPAAPVVAEATGPDGALATYTVTATDGPGGVALAVQCNIPSGAQFPLGATDVICTALSSTQTTGTFVFTVVVRDTTNPAILVDPVIEVEATSPTTTNVVLAPTATDIVSGTATLANKGDFAEFSCDRPTESAYPIGDTTVTCVAKDGALNAVMKSFVVRVAVKAPEFPGGTCFVVDFREITYFRNQTVLSSSDDAIRAAAGIAGSFDPAAWPYRATGGTGYTKSKATLFRIYGFAPSQVGQQIPDADDYFASYTVTHDAEAKGYYIDLGGPGRVFVCPEQLHNYLLGSRTQAGNLSGTTVLPTSQRNVPGIMLTRNAQILKIPARVRTELAGLGRDPGSFGAVSYIGVQLQGNGSNDLREFVDVEVSFPGDSETDRLQHFTSGFHTAINLNFETFNGCNYIDSAPGNDATRQRDPWGPNLSKYQGYNAWQACGTREPAVNKKQRANYEVAANAVQIVPTVSVGTDSLSLFYGPIQKVTLTTRQKIELLLTNWYAWDIWEALRAAQLR